MLSKNDVRDAILNEYKIIKQLVTKLPEGSDDFRISDDQRSTIEVLRYLTLVGPGVVHAGLDNGFTWVGENAAASEKLGMADIPAYLDGAMAEIHGLFEKMTDEEFANRDVHVEGMGDWKMNTWLLNTVMKFVPAYKLMLFNHAKAAGNADIGTWDAWMDNGEVPAPTG